MNWNSTPGLTFEQQLITSTEWEGETLTCLITPQYKSQNPPNACELGMSFPSTWITHLQLPSHVWLQLWSYFNLSQYLMTQKALSMIPQLRLRLNLRHDSQWNPSPLSGKADSTAPQGCQHDLCWTVVKGLVCDFFFILHWYIESWTWWIRMNQGYTIEM